MCYLNFHIDEYYNEEWMGNDEKTKQHVDDVSKYLLNHYKGRTFEERITETRDIYLNNIDVRNKVNASENLTKNIEADDDPIRVIKYILQ